MPKPPMTPEDVEALTIALQETHAAEVMSESIPRAKAVGGKDRAIKKARETRDAWITLGTKIFTNWPV